MDAGVGPAGHAPGKCNFNNTSSQAPEVRADPNGKMLCNSVYICLAIIQSRIISGVVRDQAMLAGSSDRCAIVCKHAQSHPGNFKNNFKPPFFEKSGASASARMYKGHWFVVPVSGGCPEENMSAGSIAQRRMWQGGVLNSTSMVSFRCTQFLMKGLLPFHLAPLLRFGHSSDWSLFYFLSRCSRLKVSRHPNATRAQRQCNR